ELRRLARPDTLVCRCEDVAMSRCEGASSIREAKLATRAGMGPCQGRVCGPALRFLHGWPPDSARPPLSPTSLAALMQEPPSSRPPTPARLCWVGPNQRAAGYQRPHLHG